MLRGIKMFNLTSKYLMSSQDLGPRGPAYISSPPRFINKSCKERHG